MRRSLLGLLAILVISGCAAIAHDRGSDNKKEPVVVQRPGFGPEINAVLVATGLGFAGWLGNRSARWGIKSQEATLKSDILAQVESRIKGAIADSQALEREKIERKLDGIQSTLMNLEKQLDTSKVCIERRLERCENEIKIVEGNVENFGPMVNQILSQTFGAYGVTPAGQLSIRKGNVPSNPEFYALEGHMD